MTFHKEETTTSWGPGDDKKGDGETSGAGNKILLLDLAQTAGAALRTPDLDEPIGPVASGGHPETKVRQSSRSDPKQITSVVSITAGTSKRVTARFKQG